MCQNRSEGVCAVCKSENVDYGACEFEGNQMFYEIDCLDCGASGKEWYAIRYIETDMEKIDEKILNNL